MTFNLFGGRVLDLDIRSDALILYRPLAGEIIEREAGRGDAPTINRRWSAERPDKPSPGARAYQRTNLAQPEIVRQRVAARARRLVDDHYFWTVDSGSRRR